MKSGKDRDQRGDAALNDVRFRPPEDHVEIRAFLVRDEAGSVELRDMDGTWIVNRKDIIQENAWPDAPKGFDGKAVKVQIRANATVRQVREFQILPTDRPIIYPDPAHPSPFVGMAELQHIARRWAAKLGFTPGDDPRGPLAATTASCWDSGEWATDCSPDDCG